MPEVVADRGKVRRFLLQSVAQKPAVAVVGTFFCCGSAQGRQAVQMLDQHHFEQCYGIYALSAVILAVQFFNYVIQFPKIHCRIYFAQ